MAGVTVSGTDGSTANIVVWVFIAVSIVLVVLRLLARVKMTKFYGVDDFFIVIALLFDVIFAILNSVAVANGFGTHFDRLSHAQQTDALKWDLITHTMASWALAVPKLALVALLIRVFEPRKIMIIALYAAAVFGVVTALVASLLWVLRCSPVEANWDRSVQGTCWDLQITNQFSSFQFAWSVICDFTFALYPAPILWKLQMSKGRKIAIGVNMGLGMVAGAVGIYKLSILKVIGENHRMDLTYYETTIAVWIAIEGNLLIFAACIPTIGPIVRQILRLGSSRGFSGGAGATNSGGTNKQDRYERMLDERRPRRTETDGSTDDDIALQDHDTIRSNYTEYQKYGHTDEEADIGVATWFPIKMEHDKQGSHVGMHTRNSSSLD